MVWDEYAVAFFDDAAAFLGAARSFFTDLENPVSNGVYARIGYVPTRDAVNFALVDPTT